MRHRDRFELYFSGYFRGIAKRMNVPGVIIDVIFEYQHSVWDEEVSSPDLIITDQVVSGEHNHVYRACFGSTDYESGSAEWKIKIHKVASYIKCGIIDSKQVSPTLSTFGDYAFGYGYNSSGQLRNNRNWKQYGDPFGNGDVVTTILDMDAHTLSFKHWSAAKAKERDLGIAYNIEKGKEFKSKYRFVVESYGGGDVFEMI